MAATEVINPVNYAGSFEYQFYSFIILFVLTSVFAGLSAFFSGEGLFYTIISIACLALTLVFFVFFGCMSILCMGTVSSIYGKQFFAMIGM